MAQNAKNINLRNIDLKNIYEWPIYGRVLVFILICMGVFYFGYFFDFSNQGDQIYSRYKEEQDLKQQVKTIVKSEQAMREVVSQYPEIVKLLNQWQEQLITANNLPDLLNQILKIGAANHIQFSIFAPGAKKLQDDYFRVPIKVVMQGSYSQLASFMSQVANMPQLVSVGNFIIFKQNGGVMSGKPSPEEAQGPDSLISELTLEVYYLANKK